MAPRRALVRRAVEVDQRLVERRLVERVEPVDRLGDLAVDVADRLRDALAELARRRRRAARWPRTRRSRRREGTAARPRAPERSATLDLDGRVAAGVEDLAGVDGSIWLIGPGLLPSVSRACA